ncbi:MAG TPA: CocE/NonD family hydrolase [Devosia sp.]|nr:CocE/NonD family hydrolase [Devosia sp.]
MSVGTFFLRRAAKLPKRLCRARAERGLMVPVRDGVRLETEVYTPRLEGKHPTILIRAPYGLRGFGTAAEVYAERGFNCVIQACRGTGRSEGEFDPLTHERNDGLDVLDWIKAQPFYDGRLGTAGPSYLGYAQWAICDALPRQSAMSVKVSSAEFRSIVFPGGGFQLQLWLSWIQVIEGIRTNVLGFARSIGSGAIEKQTLAASLVLPLTNADRLATGHDVPFWKHWLGNSIGSDEFWHELDHTHRLGPRTPPTSFVSGWYDFMIDQLLRDYETLTEAGRPTRLTIGPWWHVSPELQYESIRDTLSWMNAELNGDPSGLGAAPVRLHIGGSNQWREFQSFPPGAPDTQVWHLHPDQVLSQRPVKASTPDAYRYDPADPTPSVGGAMFAFTGAGPQDQARLESRNDVLLYTSEPLFSDLTVIGNVRAVIYARASLPDADLFVRLSDVDPSGQSINICDGYLRKSSADAAVPDNVWKLTIRLNATGHCFRRDHRLRLLIASGAHPRYARNTGTSEPFGTTTTLVPMDMEIFHDPTRPSAIHLPVYEL